MSPIPLLTLPPLVSALILNYRSPQQTVECVQALLKQTIVHDAGGFRIIAKTSDSLATSSPLSPLVGERGTGGMGEGKDLQYTKTVQPREKGYEQNLEIIVIDNHSQDDSIGVIRNRLGHLPNLKIIETPVNRGFGGGYAAGALHATGTYFLINNPDKKLAADAVESMIKRMEADDSIGILAPKLIHDDASVRHSARAFPRPYDVVIKRTFLQRFFPRSLRRYLQLDHSIDEERDVDWVVGGCLLMRGGFFKEIGGFDPRYFLFFEDIDLCRTCWNKGKRVVYFPGAVATDRKRRLSEMSAFSMMWHKTGRAHIASALKYFWKWGV